jgi:hypothetical protein
MLKERAIIRVIFFALAGLPFCIGQGWGEDSSSPSQDFVSSKPQDQSAKNSYRSRRVYVLHSGIHTILSNPEKNIAAITLREGLLKRGVEDDNIVVLDNPFPKASWKSMFPIECFKMFAECAMPESRVSLDAYVRFHKAMQAKKVDSSDQVIWLAIMIIFPGSFPRNLIPSKW